MLLTTALLVSAGLSLAGGLVSGWAQNEADKKKRDELDLQLTQTKAQNSYNALASANQNTQYTQATAMGIESQLAGFNAQVDKYATQATQATGSLNARSAMSGFRNSGANTNATANQIQQSKFDISYLNSNIDSSMIQTGAQNIAQANSYSNSMAGYKQNIDHAIASRNLQVDNLGIAENYFLSWRMLGDAGTSLLNWGINTASSWAGAEMSNSVANTYKVEA